MFRERRIVSSYQYQGYWKCDTGYTGSNVLQERHLKLSQQSVIDEEKTYIYFQRQILSSFSPSRQYALGTQAVRQLHQHTKKIHDSILSTWKRSEALWTQYFLIRFPVKVPLFFFSRRGGRNVSDVGIRDHDEPHEPLGAWINVSNCKGTMNWIDLVLDMFCMRQRVTCCWRLIVPKTI